MTANTSLAKGRDPRYLTEGAGTGHAGGTRYYSEAAGEPPGIWHGALAPGLGQTGDVDGDQLQALYMDRAAPDGQRLDARARPHFRPFRSAWTRPWPLTWWPTHTPRRASWPASVRPSGASPRARSLTLTSR